MLQLAMKIKRISGTKHVCQELTVCELVETEIHYTAVHTHDCSVSNESPSWTCVNLYAAKMRKDLMQKLQRWYGNKAESTNTTC